MQRDWQMAQKRLLEDLAGDAHPFDANGAGGGAQDMQLGAFGEAGAASVGHLIPQLGQLVGADRSDDVRQRDARAGGRDER